MPANQSAHAPGRVSVWSRVRAGEIRRPAKPELFLQARAQHRADFLLDERLRNDVRGPGRPRHADREVDPIAHEIHRRVARRQLDLDSRMRGAEGEQTRDEPAHGEGAEAGHRDLSAARPRRLDDARLQKIEARGQHRQQPRARLRQPQPGAGAKEQRASQMPLQQLHLAADGAVRYAQLVRRRRDRAESGRRLEGAECVEGRQGPWHQRAALYEIYSYIL